MSALNRTCLTTEQKIKLGTSIFAAQDQYGAITHLSNEFGVSRNTVYDVKSTMNTLIFEHYNIKETAFQAVNVVVDKTQRDRAIVCLRSDMPASIRNIEDALPKLYPGIHSPSFGTIQSITSEAEQRAKELNDKVNLSNAVNVAMDEMYSQGDPVLAMYSTPHCQDQFH